MGLYLEGRNRVSYLPDDEIVRTHVLYQGITSQLDLFVGGSSAVAKAFNSEAVPKQISLFDAPSWSPYLLEY